MTDTIAITGVTGDVGGKTLELLRDSGAPVRAVVRRHDQAERLRARGIDARLADLDDLDALTHALDGVDRYFLVTPVSERQAEQGETGVRAAQRAGVPRVVHLSGGDAAEHSPMPWAAAAWRTDRILRESGLAWTILHPSAFMTNLLPSAPAIRRGWFPHTLAPPQVQVRSATPTSEVLMIRPLKDRTLPLPPLSAAEVVFWHGDYF